MNLNVHDWYKKKNYGEILFSYEGSISTDSINSVLSSIEEKLYETKVKVTIIKKVFNIVIESLQNLYHHIDDAPEDENKMDKRFGIFVLSKTENSFKISSANFLKVEKKKLLKDRMDQVNSLDKIERKNLYKYVLGNEEYTDKGGGGLGLIDIARRTGNKLEYNFHDYNKDYFFFSLDIKLSIDN